MDFVSLRLVHVSVRARGEPLVCGSRTGFRPHLICLRGGPLSVGPVYEAQLDQQSESKKHQSP